MAKRIQFGRSQPNKGRERRYRLELQQLNEQMQNDMRESLISFFRANYASDAKKPSDTDKPKTLAQLMQKMRKRWYDKYEKRGRILQRWMANSTKELTEKEVQNKMQSIGMTLKPNYSKSDKKLVKNIVSEGVGLIKSIPQQYIGKVQESATAAFLRGYDSEKLYNKINDILDDLDERNENRAFLISRDQMQKATQKFMAQSAMELGATKGRWIHVPGMKSSRETHQAFDGRTFDLSVGLFDEDVGLNVLPGDLPYCMCQFEVLMPGFED